MKLAAACAVLVLAAAVPAAAAHRAPAYCATIVDDQRGLVETTVGEPSRDLRSATMGSDGRSVTVALRLAALPREGPAAGAALVDYTMRFTVGDGTAFLTTNNHPGAVGSYGVDIAFRPVVLGRATVVRDPARGELRVTAPLAGFAPHVDLRPGGTASNLNALVALTPSVASTAAVARVQTVVVDGASGPATYQLGSRSCVPVRG